MADGVAQVAAAEVEDRRQVGGGQVVTAGGPQGVRQTAGQAREGRQGEDVLGLGRTLGIRLGPGAGPGGGEDAHQGDAVVWLQAGEDRQGPGLAALFQGQDGVQQGPFRARGARQGVEDGQAVREVAQGGAAFRGQGGGFLVVGAFGAQAVGGIAAVGGPARGHLGTHGHQGGLAPAAGFFQRPQAVLGALARQLQAG